MFHSLSLLNQSPLAHGSSALPSVLLLLCYYYYIDDEEITKFFAFCQLAEMDFHHLAYRLVGGVVMQQFYIESATTHSPMANCNQ